ncbi:MAG: T9SS type A sorting domain-containing protein, partial [Cytophagaceae bacterium]|nr:T9SS type A sorting domain-containing protein [Cytophagaceae bacterium]
NGIVFDGDSKRGIVKGNFVGVGVDGVTDLGNWTSGIYFLSTSDTAIIGGSTFMERNVSSCNGKVGTTGDGIRIEGPDGHTILGNFSGVDSTGTIIKPNTWAGLSLNESDDNIVGGSGAFEGNVFSGNLNEGIWLRNASRNKIYGNFVGTDRTGTLQLGNQDWGIAISAAGPNFDNIVGGSLANANTIAYNLNIAGPGSGVDVANDSHRNLITFNKIYCNAGLGILLNGAANESVATPAITLSGPNAVNGTGTPGYTVHIYRNVTSDGGVKCDCEGEIYIGTTVVTGGGTWSYTHNLGLTGPQADAVTATQTNGSNSTSQFTSCTPPMPVTYLYFTAMKIENTKALLSWATSWEKNNKVFIIQRSLDGINFENIGTVNGNNNSTEEIKYSFVDTNPPLTLVYYRIEQIDFDGKSSLTSIRTVSFTDIKINIIQASDKEIIIQTNFSEASELTVMIFAANGQLCYKGRLTVAAGFLEETISLHHLAAGIYMVNVYNSEAQEVKKVALR